ncbi:MAG: hypothetical protein V3S30_06360 [Thermoanaerobaculia bacterium]
MLGEQLLKRGWISRQTLDLALSKQQNFGSQLGTNLLDIDAITEDQLMSALSADMHLPIAQPKDLLGATPEALALLDRKTAIRAKALPFRVNGTTLDLATVNATDLDLVDELSFAVGKRIKVYISHEARIAQALEKHYGQPTNARITNILDRIDRGGRRAKSQMHEEASAESLSTVSARHPPTSSSSIAEQQQTVVRLETTEATAAQKKEPGGEPESESPEPAASDQTASSLTIPLSPEELFELTTGKSELKVETAGTLANQDDRDSPSRRAKPVNGAPPSPVSESDPSELAAFENATSPDEIGNILLSVLSPLFTRIILLRFRKSVIVGWKGWGTDIDHRGLRDFSAPEDEPSIFVNLKFGSGIYKGYLAKTPTHERLSKCWGGGLNRECVLAQIKVRDRPVCILYADWVGSATKKIDFAWIERLAANASMAFEMCVIRQKMRRG